MQFSYRLVDDTESERPFDDLESVRIVVLHRRYSDPANGSCGRSPEEVSRWMRANHHTWFILPLWLYDHSGTVYKPGAHNPFSCPFDSGRVGIIALRKRDFKPAKRAQMAEEICRAYSAWANGECYGFQITDADGMVVDAEYGFYGADEAAAAAQKAIAALEAEQHVTDCVAS